MRLIAPAALGAGLLLVAGLVGGGRRGGGLAQCAPGRCRRLRGGDGRPPGADGVDGRGVVAAGAERAVTLAALRRGARRPRTRRPSCCRCRSWAATSSAPARRCWPACPAGSAAASTVVDVTVELVAQLGYTALGLLLLDRLRPPFRVRRGRAGGRGGDGGPGRRVRRRAGQGRRCGRTRRRAAGPGAAGPRRERRRVTAGAHPHPARPARRPGGVLRRARGGVAAERRGDLAHTCG